MEIERKFLVEDVPDGLSGPSGVPIEQSYLAIDEGSEVRLRRAGDSLTLTVKNGHGESRQETEVDVDQATFDELWPESEGRRVEKVRHRIDLEGGLVAELDVYSGGMEGTSVVEVEFDSEAAAREFRPRAWFGRELTGDRAWANQSLAVHGRPSRPDEFRLRAGEDPATGVCRVIAARSAQAAAAVRQAGEAEDSARSVHEARKSLKKVRSALRLLRGVIPDEERSTVNSACREAGGRLSGARDAEVKMSTLGQVTGENAEPDGAERWRGELEEEAGRHRGGLTSGSLSEVEDAIENVRRAFQGRQPAGDCEAVAGNAGRAYRRGRKAMKRARKSGEADDFHAWRKRAKDLRYQLEILGPRLPDEFDELRKRATELADKLGDLHDFDVLAEDLQGRDLDPEARSVLSVLIADARGGQIETCLQVGAETCEMKPGRFTNRVGEALSGQEAPRR
ncbi:MAG: CHAD domain-containing protein [Solirubrobacterales bacterium]|nr:CHAD domain-containing protein [Solirubrobacterales bacterium]